MRVASFNFKTDVGVESFAEYVAFKTTHPDLVKRIADGSPQFLKLFDCFDKALEAMLRG
jgi:hypothetical protein